MWIGRTGPGEDAWLAFVDRTSFLEDIDEGALPSPNANSSQTTCLAQDQQRQVKMFLAHCFLYIGYRDVTITKQYPDVDNEMEYKSATNIFNRYLDLNFELIKALDNAIVTQYDSWVEASPPSYRANDFLSSRMPICVTSRFGQNHKLGVSTVHEEQTWNNDRDWSCIRFVNVAIATHVRIQRVNQWHPTNIDNLVEVYAEGIFDSPDVKSRNKLTRRQIQAILDAPAGDILPCLYSNRGYVIDTHDPEFGPMTQPYGVLVKASRLQQAFAPLPPPPVVTHPLQVNDPRELQDTLPPADSPTTAVPFFFYPQAGLRTVGHFQASGLFSTCYPIVSRLNQRFQTRNASIPGDQGQNFYALRHSRVVQPISSQGYNAIMHHTRGRTAQHHDAQLGIVTAALAGQWIPPSSRSSYSHAQDYLAQCRFEMPHEAFNMKIQPDGLSRDLRLENVYCFDLFALHPALRLGSVIINDIITPLLRIWDHATTRASLKNHVQLFLPEAYPALYSWTTYPLACLLDCVFTVAEPLYPSNKFKHALMVELCSVIERALNYMHTGNAAVIATSVMAPLWIGKALITDGLPCFYPECVAFNGGSFEISPEYWPFASESTRPLSSSKSTQLFRFEKKHFNGFYAHLAMGILLERPPPPFVKETNELRQRAFTIMAYCIALFIDDCKDLVSTEVYKAIKRQSSLPFPESGYAAVRSAALRQWKTAPYPLSYGGNQSATYNALISSIYPNPHIEPPEGMRVTESLSYHNLAKRIIAAIIHPGRSIPAPLWKGGSCVTALGIAVPEIQGILHVPESDFEDIVAEILATTLRDLKVEFVPWHATSRSARGTCRVASYLHWMLINHTDEIGPLIRSHPPALAPMETSQPTRSRFSALANRGQMQEEATIIDRFSAWNVPPSLFLMKGLWDKAVLPAEWSFENAHLDTLDGQEACQYVIDVYAWARDSYDGDNWRHHMSLVWAILTTTILPHLYIPVQFKAEARKEKTAQALNEAIRCWKWVEPPPNKKGVTSAPPFITMITTYIMAVLDPSSPLLAAMPAQNGFGVPWTGKHGSKYIHALTMIRLGIADAISTGALGASKFRGNYDIRPENQLKALYDRVIHYLRHEEFGEFFAICEVFGLEMAEWATKNGHCARPVVQSS
ncbi:hypothetical protein AGABI1DRAFT_133148 [Agaricus bisporus var. burnettii JB137-S8]|uniref:DUF8190 domain-containing protein n=1 Tax=Agaricus bisporus var. burnettii (strain JB137-S8 / ATCC MYA-4627 / FGSC 10392) TaxID=597362 RepID=K5XJ94_AGABU|nr:uncharacterized protein AGABI1DRAFT_133148 [Agaricus bisporus var. burnettii JB137-S8]EKM74525.1 hypothetical protein AGABI1DRAFT_133148 [Agaricus bisporus var. burnettii JB137-S8]